MKNKFELTREENIFLAKKEIVANIYNSAKLEGINTTYPDTKTILEGINVPTLKLDEINCILNLKDAWKYLINTISDPLSLDYICQINNFVSRNESLEWGKLRTGKIGINGVDYIPEIPVKDKVIEKLNELMLIENNTQRAINIMLYLMRSQIFWDGNKRTSMLIANKIMIKNGNGIISVKEKHIAEFNKLLTEYYNTNKKSKIEKFIYDNCIYGIDKE